MIRSNLFPILRTEEGETISDGMTDSQQRTYHVAADNLVTRQVVAGSSIDPSVPPPKKTQWLVWYHEATVVEVVNDRVVTFETGPIGLHTNWRLSGTSGILANPNIYIGFAPAGLEPKDVDVYLKDILPGR